MILTLKIHLNDSAEPESTDSIRKKVQNVGDGFVRNSCLATMQPLGLTN